LTGEPIRELQSDLRAIGYYAPVDGTFDAKTEFAVHVFQKHFFSGSRRGSALSDKQFGMVDRVTAEFIKNVRPVSST
jgi:peptidoglycan hydrolase-like protein with peptidoglycan-binding domain